MLAREFARQAPEAFTGQAAQASTATYASVLGGHLVAIRGIQ